MAYNKKEVLQANTAKRYWESIKASVLTSFYTDTRIVSAISDALASTNLQVRRCLVPSMDMGAHILKLKRKRLLQQSTLPEQPILLLTRFVILSQQPLSTLYVSGTGSGSGPGFFFPIPPSSFFLVSFFVTCS